STGGGGKRSRGGATAGPATPANGTHVITEGVKSALAQIAASTIHHEDEAPAPAVVAPESVIELPEGPAAESPAPERKKRKKRQGPSKPKSEKELLLDSVLSALPEPKAPGQGRARRRVTTAALSGTPVVLPDAD